MGEPDQVSLRFWGTEPGRVALRRPFLNITSEIERIPARENHVDLHYSDGVAAERTMIALEGTAVAFQSRLPKGWDLVPNTRDDRCDAAPFGKAVP